MSGIPQAGSNFRGGRLLMRRLGNFSVAYLAPSKGGLAAMAEVSNDNVDDRAGCRDGHGGAGNSFSDSQSSQSTQGVDNVTDIKSRSGFKAEEDSTDSTETEVGELLLPWSVACDGLFWETPSVLEDGNLEAVRYLFDPIRVSCGLGMQSELELLVEDCLAEDELEGEDSHSLSYLQQHGGEE